MITSVIIWFPLAWVHPLFLASGRNEVSLRAAVVHSIVSTALYVSLGDWPQQRELQFPTASVSP